MWTGIIDRYKDHLPVTDLTPIISLNEGNTPLIALNNLAKKYQIAARWHAKFEGLNPTGSFKDRGMTLAITKAVENKAKMVICASTGNTSAAAAAYSARAGIACCVLIPEGKIAFGKLAQAMLHGAIVLQIEGNFDNALSIVRDVASESPITLVNSVNPFRIEGQKTGAFEIVDALGQAPDFHFIPVGNAGNITAYWKGYQDYYALGKSHKKPRMMGYQAAGSAPIVCGYPIDNPDTIATAIRIGNPASWEGALQAKNESGGLIAAVTDAEITQAQKELAAHEGIFCEPASAAAIAGVLQHHASHPFQNKDEIIVSVLTGHGLKDPNRAIDISTKAPVKVASTKEAVLDSLQAYL